MRIQSYWIFLNFCYPNSNREKSFYNSILIALSRKKKGLSELSKLMNEDVTKINKYMKTLFDAEIVIKKEIFNSSRQVYYYIEDPVLKFYYQFLLKILKK